MFKKNIFQSNVTLRYSFLKWQLLPFLGLLSPFLATDADSASTKNATMNTNITDNSITGIRHRRLLPVRNSHLAIVVYKVTYLILTQL